MRSRPCATLAGALLLALALAACGAAATPTTTRSSVLTCNAAAAGAAVTLDGQRLNYTCPKQGSYDVGLFGDVTAGDKGWQIDEKTYQKAGAGYQTVSTTPMLVSAIALIDGTKCSFAGTGATITVSNKRVNYTCPRAGSDEVALIGDIVAGGQGFQIEKASYTFAQGVSTVKATAMVPIKALDVAPLQ
jgi:hypothetical protein